MYSAAGAAWKPAETGLGLPALRWQRPESMQRVRSQGDLICAAKLQQPAWSEFLPFSVEVPVPSQPEVGLVERVSGVGRRTD